MSIKAIEARRKASFHQFFKAVEKIEGAIKVGRSSTMLYCVNPEVAKRLAKDGYDVKIVCFEDGSGYTEVFWSSAEEGRTGTAKVVFETKGTENLLSLDEMTDYDVALEAALKVHAEAEHEFEENLKAALKTIVEAEHVTEEALVAALKTIVEAEHESDVALEAALKVNAEEEPEPEEALEAALKANAEADMTEA